MEWQPRETGSGLLSSVPDLWFASIRSRSRSSKQSIWTSPPYALALDGEDLWVSSFHDSAVVRVDTVVGETSARIEVDSPTGIAVGGDAVWVVGHRSDSLMRIDPLSDEVAATIRLGEPGDHPECSMCVENVVFAFGSAWTANNAGRSVTRIDPATNAAVEIPLEMRAWAVAAAGDSIWASQFDELDETHVDLEAGGVAELDPATNEVQQFELPGTLGVASGHDSLWVVALGRRSDIVYRYAAPLTAANPRVTLSQPSDVTVRVECVEDGNRDRIEPCC